ncbi:hypothetical protein CferDRAFT_1272 [Chlorobium ferrooxidans DSM 13031]|uniref:Uncharacterized protein n=2 Tax=Chlorobium TaxID=1091 RepID=Q0YSC6_9CHLB|nr:hypothetical protein CferDRAFT_1272 [Chlorobium ferrooxidans DSM 13031]
MNIDRLSQFALALFITIFSISSYANSESEVLLGLNQTPKTIDIRVATGGCTQKEDFKIDVKKGLTEKSPYSITIYRIKNDYCKAYLPEGVLLSFTKEELGINGLTEFIVTNRFGNTSQHLIVGIQEDHNFLKKVLLDATIQAINMDIKRYKAWIEQASDKVKKAEYKQGLDRLVQEKQKYQTMKPIDYELPKKITLVGQYEGRQILFKGQSKLGPFYNVVASSSPLTKGKEYSFEFYLVYPREYQFPSYYVYVTKAGNE